jgi:PAS domain S-box-containing protein
MQEPENQLGTQQRSRVRGGVRAVGFALCAGAAASLGLGATSSSFVLRDAELALCLLGAALALATWSARAAQLGSHAAAAAGLALLAASSSGYDLAAHGVQATLAPGAGVVLAVLGCSLLLRRWPRPSQWLALAVLAFGLVDLLGRLYGIPALYRHAGLGEVSAPMALVLMASATAVVFLHPGRGLARALLDRSDAGTELRRIAGAAVLPVVLGWLVLTGMHATGYYQSSFGVALLAITSVLAFFAVAYWSYSSLHTAESGRARARSELAAREERYRRTFEQARIGIAHVSPEGRWLQVNQRLVEILGYAEPELLGMTYSEVSHLEDLEVDVRQWELLRRGEISDYAVERRFRSKSGEIIYADVRITREEDEGGELRHYIVVLQDVTARKLSDGTRRMYERALAATQNGVMITDALRDDLPIVYANPALLAITGYSSAEVTGRNPRFLNQAFRDQPVLEELRLAIASGKPCSVLVRNQRKNGEAFWNQLAIAPIEDADGRLTHFVGVMVDATERVQVIAEREDLLAAAQSARLASEAANRAKDRFLSVVSHELRSPLNAILAWTSILRDEPGEEVARVAKAIETSVHTQSRLVDELLDASRIREGTLQVEPVRIDLEACVRTAVEGLRALASERGIALSLRTPGPAFALADPERIEQVVRNIADNALKFTPRGGHVDVELLDGDDRWAIEVRDDGRGIEPAELSRVFEEFWQADEDSGQKPGLGLGLLIVKHLVERHGGGVTVHSDGRNRGTRVRVELPRDTGPAPAAAPSPPGDDLRGVEVVVVDDDATTVQAIGMALARSGAICRLCTSVSEALSFFERGTPDALISDIGLPDRNGFDLIRSVRMLGEPQRSVLAIAVTGLVDPAERKLIRRAGFDTYIAKPVAPEVVIDRLVRLRALQALPEPPSRRLLLVDPDAASSAEGARLLRERGHEVREVGSPQEALVCAAEFRPHVVLARATPDLDPTALAERLASRGSRADLVGLGDDGPDLKAFDRIVPLPLDPDSIDRLIRFTEDT